MATNSGAKQDGNPRKPMKAELRVYYGPSQKIVLYGFSVDMSSGGLFLKTETLFSIDEKVMLSFTLPDADKIVNCSAKVAWVNLKDEPKKPFASQFTILSASGNVKLSITFSSTEKGVSVWRKSPPLLISTLKP